MSVPALDYGKFDNIGDVYVLQLQPIVNVTSIVSYTDITYYTDDEGFRYFTKEFRYSIDNKVTFTSWATLTNPNLVAITFNPIDIIYMEIRYTRVGTSSSGSIRWNSFSLSNVTVTPCITLKIKKSVYDSVYGTYKYNEIINVVSKFNDWSLKIHGVTVYPIIDNTLTDQSILININDACSTLDFNVLLKSDWGKRFIKTFTDIDIDLYSKPRV